MLQGMKEPRKGDRDSILASSLAGEIARSRLKPRQRSVGLAIELRKARLDQDADSVPVREEGNTTTSIIASGRSVLRSLRTRAR